MNKFDKNFDYIVCDTPPTLSVADSRVLSHYFDGIVIVSMSNKTTYPMLNKTIKTLSSVKAPILGVLLNGIREEDQPEYYSQYSSYYQDKGTEKNNSAKVTT